MKVLKNRLPPSLKNGRESLDFQVFSSVTISAFLGKVVSQQNFLYLCAQSTIHSSFTIGYRSIAKAFYSIAKI